MSCVNYIIEKKMIIQGSIYQSWIGEGSVTLFETNLKAIDRFNMGRSGPFAEML